MPLVVDIKNRINTLLGELVTATTLGSVHTDDFNRSFLNRNIVAWPAAILTSPAIESIAGTNRDNERTHIFNIIILQKGENVASATDIETLQEAIMDKFDNDVTLNGAANGGMQPSTTPAEPITLDDKTYITFTIALRCRAIKVLTF